MALFQGQGGGTCHHLHMPFVQCEALLRSGTACRSAALTDSAFCSHHATLVEEIGEERVRAVTSRAVDRAP